MISDVWSRTDSPFIQNGMMAHFRDIDFYLHSRRHVPPSLELRMDSDFRLKYLLTLVFFLLHWDCSGGAAAPNIIFILADDLGWDDVGFHGSEIKTPNIDHLARQGVILNNYYVQPLCSPTRSAILTGKYPIHTGLQHLVIKGSEPYGLPLTEKTMAQHLKSLGYQTHAVGKWHLGFFKKTYLPTYRGFDSHMGYYQGKEDYFSHYCEDGGYYGYDFHQNGQTLWHQNGSYSTELFSSHAESIIRSHDTSKPLFLYLAHQAVHAGNPENPIEVPQKYVDRFPNIKNVARRKFAGMVSALDDSVQRVYKALQEAGIADNSILVFSTDNGGPANGMGGNAACNWPLRGSKETLWEGGVRGVGFILSPLLQQSGYVSDNLMHAVDWLPTLLSIAVRNGTTGREPDKQILKPLVKEIDGIDQWDFISNHTTTSRKEVLLNIDPTSKTESVIVGEFKLISGRSVHGRYDGWYPPPYQEGDDSQIDGKMRKETEPDSDLELMSSQTVPSNSDTSSADSTAAESDVDDLILKINEKFDGYNKRFSLRSPSSDSVKTVGLNHGHKMTTSHSSSSDRKPNNVIVHCGPKPLNASTNCHPPKKACLFHLTSDPCEYNNLAEFLPDVVKLIQGRLDVYRSSMIPPANKPSDPDGNPALHGGVWQPWQ